MELENSASQDAAVREKIANLPAEVQDVSLLEKIEGKGSTLCVVCPFPFQQTMFVRSSLLTEFTCRMI